MRFHKRTGLVDRGEIKRARLEIREERAPRTSTLIEKNGAVHDDDSIGVTFGSSHDLATEPVEIRSGIVSARLPGRFSEAALGEVDRPAIGKGLLQHVAENRGRGVS